MARVLAVSSEVAFGPVGNSAAVPALQAKGHEVLAVPTVILSNHPGHGTPVGFRTEPAQLAAIIERATSLTSIDAVMTGYFAGAEQVDVVARAVSRVKPAYVLVDPVIGDGGKLYVAEPVAQAIRDLLLPLASCATPNRFELEWLTGWLAGTVDDAVSAARSLNLAEVVVTSIPAGEGRLATLAVTADHASEQYSGLRASVPHGTGDFLAGLYLAERLERPPPDALARAMQILERAIARSAGSAVLDVAGALHRP